MHIIIQHFLILGVMTLIALFIWWIYQKFNSCPFCGSTKTKNIYPLFGWYECRKCNKGWFD